MRKIVRIEKIGRTLEELLDDIKTLREEAWETYDKLPEPIQQSIHGKVRFDEADNLSSAEVSLGEAIEYLAAAIGK